MSVQSCGQADRLDGGIRQIGTGWEAGMAQKKAKSAPAARKTSASDSAVVRRAIRQDSAAANSASDPGRLLREAAWSRMFGRVEAKNPFAR
jgi:hypothetical protein